MRINSYKTIRIGLSYDETEKAFWWKPDIIFAVDDCTCIYYAGSGMFAVDVKPPAQPPVSLQELPSYYDAIQVLFDKNKKVIAFTWIGEIAGTNTIVGEFKGRSGIDSLPPEIISALIAQCQK